MEWSEDDDARLRSLLAAGCSAGQAGKELGRTRNSVIGRAFRLKIPLKGRPAKAAEIKPKKKKAKSPNYSGTVKTPTRRVKFWEGKRNTKPFQRSTKVAANTQKYLERQRLSIQDARVVSILELTNTNCRYPVSDSTGQLYGFCGKPRWHDRTQYCEECHSHCYYTPRTGT